MTTNQNHAFRNRSGDTAPLYLYLPDLSEVLAHRADPPENIGLFFFKLANCGR